MLRFVALVLLALVSGPAAAAIFAVDDRVTMPAGPELAAIGIVTGGENILYGSGFLIDACTVLTARHVGGSVDKLVGRQLTFHAGKLSSEGQIVAAGPFQSGSSEQRSIGKDWMIIRLSQCLGRQLGFLRLSTASAVFAGKHEFKVEDAGFPRDRAVTAGVTVDPDCRVLWVGRGMIAHDCATLPGNSGGPLIARDNAGWVAIGINAAGADRAAAEPFRATEANIAVDVSKLAPNICLFISKDTNETLCASPK